jgi:flagellar hook-associated protein 1 FlgK
MSGLMTLGARAMFANYAALQTTSANIANANTAGYSRQQVELATAGGQYTGAGFFGRGVSVETVTRATDAFLTREAAVSRASAAEDATRLEQLSRLEQVFPPGEQGLGHAAGSLLNAFVDVANRPQDISARQVVLARADELATRFRDASAQIDILQAGVSADLAGTVATVNTLAQRVTELNRQIAAVQSSGHTPNDLMDQRDLMISELSEHIQVTSIRANDGTLGLFIGGGQPLVMGTSAQQLKALPDLYDPSRTRLTLSQAGSDLRLSAEGLGGGSLAGLLKFQNEDLSDARALVGQLASAITSQLNDQQALGLDLRQPAATGSPLLELAAPRVLPSTLNTGAGSVTISVTDARQLQASEYMLRTDPNNAGQYLLQRLSDGLERSVTSGDTIDGFQIDVASAPNDGDRFLLQPVSNAASGAALALADPRGIAAASPVSATIGADNTGTASIESLRTVSAPTAGVTVDISFTDDVGGYSWSGSDGSAGGGTWTAGEPISINGFELRLRGVPRSGDQLQVAPTVYSGANNGNALALLSLRDERMVGEELLPGGSLSPGETITDAYARAMADIGLKVQGTRSSSAITSAVAKATRDTLSSRTGVNLDEEAARMIQFQQSYQAAAKMLQVAQGVFDTLLQMTGR